jgi:hypothetical protein
LFEALQRASQSLTTIPHLGPRTQIIPSASDVAVLQSREPEAVALASSTLKIGGYLYWELGANIRRFSLRSCYAALKKQGFDDIRVYWCRPNFEECLAMIPLSAPSPLAFALSRRPGGRVDGSFRQLVRVLVAFAIPAALVSCRSVVARKARDSSP